ncbi:hypothetical protein ACEQ8H_006471 [Pleosporales sp. CAS-2024a]
MTTAVMQTTTDDPAPGDIANSTSDAMSHPSALVDHPEGDAIRHQVEYYFSDENLPTDMHLLQCCGGRDNLPVSISRIRGFKKMQRFKPKTLVVAALRHSAFLHVSEDGTTIRRKIPFKGKCLLDEDFLEDNDAIAHDPRAQLPIVHPVQLLPLNKTEYPPGTSKNMMKPTGFESTYVEAPLRPEEAEEEEDMYDSAKPFVVRIEIAIQRFKEKRRMHEMYSKVFSKLMDFGGVEQGPRIAQGVSKQELSEMDAEERAVVLAAFKVPWDREDEKQWIVDFDGIATAFLGSSWYVNHFGYATDLLKTACQVLRSFYNYLRYHKVCPEYDAQLAKALHVCHIAEQELPKVYAAGLALPGDFNKSASTIFGGSYAALYIGETSWSEEMKSQGIKADEIGVREEEARIKFTTGVAIMGSEEQCSKLEAKTIKVSHKMSASLEVVDIQMPTGVTKSLYEAQGKLVQQKLGQLQPLGKLICKTWVDDECDEWDLPKTKYPTGRPERAGAGQKYEFWVEEDVMQECFIGLKMCVEMIILDGGIAVLDEVHEAMCSFYHVLPNELWMARKPKAWHYLEKGLPDDDEEDVANKSVADVKADDVDGEAAVEGDFEDE